LAAWVGVGVGLGLGLGEQLVDAAVARDRDGPPRGSGLTISSALQMTRRISSGTARRARMTLGSMSIGPIAALGVIRSHDPAGIPPALRHARRP
jgi:hypothetical protein